MKHLCLMVLILCLALPALALGNAGNWEVFFAMHSVRALIRVGPDLWGATNGGLFRFHLPDQTFQTFTNAEGLSANDIRAMTLDGRGNLILGMGNAYVDVFNLTTHQVTTMSDFHSNSKIFQIYALYNDQGTIYAGTDIGVSKLVYYPNLERYLIQGNYDNLIPGHPEVAVKTVRVFNGSLWVGTGQGVARGDLSSAYLESPLAWTAYTTAEGLSGNDIASLEVFHDTLYAAATLIPPQDHGLNYFNGASFVTLPAAETYYVFYLKAQGDTLYVGRPGGLYRLDNGITIRYGSFWGWGVALEFDENGGMWGGFQSDWNARGGFGQWQAANGDWNFHRPEGPEFETVNDILVENDGSLWVAGRQTGGYYNGALAHYNGQHWVSVTCQSDWPAPNPVSSDSFFGYEALTLTRDLGGNVWAGAHGGGVGWFHFAGDTILANAYYSASSGRLFGYVDPGYHKYTVVQDLMTDPAGNVWICNSFASGSSNAQPIAIVPADFIQDTAANPNWYYLTPLSPSGSPLQGAQNYADRVSEDQFGNKWFASFNNMGDGARVLDDNGTLSSTDDHWYYQGNLPSDSVGAMVLDRDGIMWVGTAAGVRYYYTTQNPAQLIGYNLVVPVSQNIRCITVDPQNNKWFGTAQGISVLAADDYTWLAHYTTADGPYPSALPGSVVNAIAFDPHTGVAYVGTDKGLAKLNTPYQGTGGAVTGVSFYPNPFIIGEGLSGRLLFQGSSMTGDTKIKIFTTSGQLVRELPISEWGLGWDGRNERGQLVGSGVYLLLAYSANGTAHTGKVAVIHQ